MRCILCGSKIYNQKYAIREYNNETYFEWIGRHIKYLLTRGFRKYVPDYLPVCEKCVLKLRRRNNVRI